jgi:probable HAF family extracellular repeat protein
LLFGRTHLALCVSILVAGPIFAAASPARADSLGLGILPGGTVSQAFGVSADGLVVIGESNSASFPFTQAFRWTQSGGMVGLGTLPGGTSSFANGVNADGSVIVGLSTSTAFPAFGEAFRWSQSGGMVGLGVLSGGSNSQAGGVNGDGSVVVGSSSATGTSEEAFRWTQTSGMTGLGFLPGGSLSVANGVSADGTIVVGNNSTNGFLSDSQAFRWTQSGGMIGLGYLPGNSYSTANAISADGTVIVGGSRVNAFPGNGQAFRWTQSGGMVGLGVLPGGTFSEANAVNANGTVIVGRSTSTNAPNGEAFRWMSNTGMQSIQNLLVMSGVNVTGWALQSATSISGNGTVIIGYGIDPAGLTEGWIARFTSGGAFITPGVVSQSFSGQAAIGEASNSAIGNALATMNEYATQAKQSQGARNTPYQVFGYGAFNSDPLSSGTLGMTVDLSPDLFIGATVGANFLKTDMVFNGLANMSGASAGAFIARSPANGIQWLAGIAATTIAGNVTRGYLDGNDLDSSKGSTTGRGFGATARLGWVFEPLLPLEVTPFASYTIATTGFDGYTESGGAFPSQFAAFTSTAQTVRLGADTRLTFSPGNWVWGTAAWAHRVDGGAGPDIAGAVIGLFSLTTPGISPASDWAELTVGARLPLWNNGAITASLTTSITPHQSTTLVSRLGVVQAF